MQLDNPRKPKLKRSVWLPTLLLIYLLGMTAYYAPSLIQAGEIARLITVFIVECAVILILHIFLKKREAREKQ